MRWLLCFSLYCIAPAIAIAETHQAAGTRINLNVTVESQVPNDEVLINYRVEKEGVLGTQYIIQSHNTQKMLVILLTVK